MSELEKIANLVARMNFARDDRDLPALAACYTADAVIDFKDAYGGHHVLTGRDRIMEIAQKAQGWGPGERHFLSLPAIKLQGQTAEVRYYTLYTMPAKLPVVPSFGDHVVHCRIDTDGQWRVFRHVPIQYAQPEGATRHELAKG
jgi:ketosteroid isomerase-like protein